MVAALARPDPPAPRRGRTRDRTGAREARATTAPTTPISSPSAARNDDRRADRRGRRRRLRRRQRRRRRSTRTPHVVLVEPKDAFVHNVGSLARAGRSRVRCRESSCRTTSCSRAGASSTTARWRSVPRRVVVASGNEIAADYVVLASGSQYPFPAKSDVDDTKAAIDKYRGAYDRLRAREPRVVDRRRCGRHRARRRDQVGLARQRTSSCSTPTTTCSATITVPTCAPSCAPN